MAMILSKVDIGMIGKLHRNCCFVAFILCLTFIVSQNTYAVTGCAVAAGSTADPNLPTDSIYVECPTLPATPCNPYSCTYNPSTGTASNCGPLTTCVINGEDPPITNPAWDEQKTGYAGRGGDQTSGKCAPPNSSTSTNYPTQYMLYCTGAKTQPGPITVPPPR